MNQDSLEVPIGEIVAEKLSRSRVFEKFGLDYCCGGKSTLNEACKEKGLDPNVVLTSLTESDSKTNDGENTDWRQADLAVLADHIEATHHAFMHRELPRLKGLMAKVVNAHAERHPDILEVSEILNALTEELTAHLAKEEEILFPIIRQMVSTGQTTSHCGEVVNPINVMEMEHDNAGQALAKLRSLTNDYQPPADGCATYQALLSGMADMEFDLHQHILKESSILFPRAIALEAKLIKG